MTTPWPHPDFSRMDASATTLWRKLTSSKAIEAIVAMDLTPEQDAQLAAQLGHTANASRTAAVLDSLDLDDISDSALASLLPALDAAIRSVRTAGQ